MTDFSQKKTSSPAAPGVPFYTPAQVPAAGTPLPSTPGDIPTLFTPLKIRGVELQNRFAVAPMCTYSADDGHMTDWHLVHLGSFALRGVPLTIFEATGVLPNGRITPECSGLWQDSQIAPLKRIVDYIHSQGQKAGIQLAHAGRKASTKAPWHYQRGKSELAGPEQGGWPENVWAPSAISYNEETFPFPKEMTVEQIQELVEAWKASAQRALKAGFDLIEIHAAHGYLISEFLSPISNQRTDQYGGSFENRTRVLREIISAVRSVIPEDMPLFVRVSATEWMEYTGQPSWDLQQTIELAKILPDLGVDLLDVSSGGNNKDQKINVHTYYQIDMAEQIRAAVHEAGKQLLVGAVGLVTSAEIAKETVQEKEDGRVTIQRENGAKTRADMVLVARQFLKEPEFVLTVADELGVDVKAPVQYLRGPLSSRPKKLTTVP
ncbi:NADPH dehydrogenase [Neurospora hispaniola]|uniref:NADPH dehydrogenase n=1 Tax=Neurospora hispaniola TaxID=588809 RepID=A0AAJ0MPU8_9PEZI|nr:NADPH dehydrogenase [Neurospora hispaniola]